MSDEDDQDRLLDGGVNGWNVQASTEGKDKKIKN